MQRALSLVGEFDEIRARQVSNGLSTHQYHHLIADALV